MYIPENGVYFQLVSTSTNYKIFSRDSPDPNVWITDGGDSDDQWFTLLYGTPGNGRADLYALKTKATPKVLFSRDDKNPHVGNYWYDGAYDDNWFTFEEGTGKHENEFRILCPATSLVLYCRKTGDPNFGNGPKSVVNDDQYFKFTYEDMVVEKVDFDIDAGQIVMQTPEVIAEQVLTNNSDVEQAMGFNFSSTVTQSSSFEYATGFTVDVGTEFKTGIPFIAEGKISLGVSTTNEWRFGDSEEFSKSYEANFNVNAGPHSSVHAKATVHRANLNVPYTITLHPKRDSSIKVYTKGAWTGVTTWDLAYEIDNVIDH